MTGRALIDYGRLLDVLDLNVDLLLDAAHGASRQALVPGCPGLTLGETVRHVGSVYRMALGWITGGRRPQRWQSQPTAGQDPGEYVRSGASALRTALADRPPEQPCATWWPEHACCGFWRRRMAHETVVHRVDVQGAAGATITPIAADIAIDGVDEVLTLWLGRRLRMLGVAGTRQAAVRVSTGQHRWTTRAGPEGTSAVRDADPGEPVDAEISGDPQQLYLWLWGRRPWQAVRHEGDEDAAAQLWALLRLATG